MSKTFATADLWDVHEARLRSCPLQFRDFGALRRFCGVIRTVKCYDDNVWFGERSRLPGKARSS
jgi:regulator of ribonuclease activity A